MTPIPKKSVGGKGKQDELRNKAVIILREIAPEEFTTYSLGILFQRDRKTISGVMQAYHERYVGLIHRYMKKGLA